MRSLVIVLHALTGAAFNEFVWVKVLCDTGGLLLIAYSLHKLAKHGLVPIPPSTPTRLSESSSGSATASSSPSSSSSSRLPPEEPRSSLTRPPLAALPWPLPELGGY